MKKRILKKYENLLSTQKRMNGRHAQYVARKLVTSYNSDYEYYYANLPKCNFDRKYFLSKIYNDVWTGDYDSEGYAEYIQEETCFFITNRINPPTRAEISYSNKIAEQNYKENMERWEYELKQ